MREPVVGLPAAQLPSPRALRQRLPLGRDAAERIARTRAEIAAALRRRDPRLVVVVGPCSLHDPDSALEYASRLALLAQATSDALIVVMRSYLEKPRSTLGWKGLINDPHLDGSCDVGHGLVLARELLLGIAELGVACGCELLEPLVAPYLSDLLSWAAVGARTSESQVHRELASRLPMPVGFKNATCGSVEAARDAMLAAASPHSTLGIDDEGRIAQRRSRGNPDRHLVLRGGASGPNFSRAHVAGAARLVASQGFARPVMVDCSHGNSGKDPRRQAEIARAVTAQLGEGSPILGLLIESHLHEGRQELARGDRLAHGVSITDACIGWDDTEALLLELAATAASKPRSSAGTLATA